MISEGDSALLPVNVDRRLPLQQRQVWISSFKISISAQPQETMRFSGSKINCFPWDQSLSVYYLPCLFMYMYMYDVQTKYFFHYNE